MIQDLPSFVLFPLIEGARGSCIHIQALSWKSFISEFVDPKEEGGYIRFPCKLKKEAFMLLFLTMRMYYTSWCSTAPFEYPTHPVDTSVSCQEIALTGHAAIASLTSSSLYSTPSLTRESHSSSIRKTSPAITAQELHPIHVEFTWGFLMIPLRAWSFDWSIIRQ